MRRHFFNNLICFLFVHCQFRPCCLSTQRPGRASDTLFLMELGLADLTRVLCAGNPMRSHGSWPGDVPSPRNLGPGGGPGLRCAGGLTHLPFVYRRLNACGSSLISGAKVPGAKLVLSGGFLRALLQEPTVFGEKSCTLARHSITCDDDGAQ